MFKLQSWRYMKTFSNVATTARCLPECRLTFHGSEVIAGIKMDVLQSDGLKGKFAEVGDMTLLAFTDLAKDHGFISVSSPGSLVIVPAGYVTVTFLPDGADYCEGLRWSFVREAQGENERAVITKAVQLMVADYGGNDDYSKLTDALNSD